MLSETGLEELQTALAEGEPCTSLRLNRRKTAPGTQPAWAATAVPWCDGGFYLDRRPRFTFDPMLHQGCYYVQEASSMFHSHVVRQLTAGASGPLRVLDSCAAPGGKTTAVIDSLPDGSLMVANDMSPHAPQFSARTSSSGATPRQWSPVATQPLSVILKIASTS